MIFPPDDLWSEFSSGENRESTTILTVFRSNPVGRSRLNAIRHRSVSFVYGERPLRTFFMSRCLVNNIGDPCRERSGSHAG
jgi:hypothetical protein